MQVFDSVHICVAIATSLLFVAAACSFNKCSCAASMFTESNKQEEWNVCLRWWGVVGAGWRRLSIGGSMPLYSGASCFQLAYPLPAPALAALLIFYYEYSVLLAFFFRFCLGCWHLNTIIAVWKNLLHYNKFSAHELHEWMSTRMHEWDSLCAV